MLGGLAKFLKYVIGIVLIPIGLFALYTWATITWVYSSGERAGYVQKLSHKGWICKTYEGELILVSMPGTQAEKFFFSVRDEAVAKRINQTVGKRVRLIYSEHIGVPTSCFGETRHFVSDVQLLDNPQIEMIQKDGIE
jgi:hypothetical protein